MSKRTREQIREIRDTLDTPLASAGRLIRDVAAIVATLVFLAICALGVALEAAIEWTASRLDRRGVDRPGSVAVALLALGAVGGAVAIGRTGGLDPAVVEARAIEMVRLTTSEYQLPDAGTVEAGTERFPDVGESITADAVNAIVGGTMNGAPAVLTAAEPAIPPQWMPATVTRWFGLYEAAGAKYGVDPVLLAIVSLVESGGNPEARSPGVGAVGLMQVYPKAHPAFDTSRALDPAYNVDYGALIMADNMASCAQPNDGPEYVETIRRAAARYNGGSCTAHLTKRESASHVRWTVGMWQERNDPTSPTFDAWMAAGGAGLVNAATSSAVEYAQPIAAADPGTLALPWPVGEAWRLSGGPHPAWNPDGGGAALDFAPPDSAGCAPSAYWATAIAPGVVASAAESGALYWPPDAGPIDTTGTVLIDHGDGLESLYSHMTDAVAIGTRVETGDRIGRPSCLGGWATGSHVHLAVRHGDRWLDRVTLGGWVFEPGTTGEYSGTATHPTHGELTVGGVVLHDAPSVARGGER